MSIDHFSHVNMRLPQSKMYAVRDFYVGVLGLTVGERPPFQSKGYWLYAGENPVVHLVETEEDTSGSRDDTGVIDHLAFHCDDVYEMRLRLNGAGVRFDSTTVPQSDQLQLIFSDPAGTRIELIFDASPG